MTAAGPHAPNLRDLTQAHLEAIHAASEAAYPSEACGLLVDSGDGLRIVPCENLQDAMHARDPQRFTRTSATAYFIDPAVLMQHDGRIRCIYHSHPDHGAYFSDEDQRAAVFFDEPAYADASYLVISVQGGRAVDQRMFVWSEAEGRFVDDGQGGPLEGR